MCVCVYVWVCTREFGYPRGQKPVSESPGAGVTGIAGVVQSHNHWAFSPALILGVWRKCLCCSDWLRTHTGLEFEAIPLLWLPNCWNWIFFVCLFVFWIVEMCALFSWWNKILPVLWWHVKVGFRPPATVQATGVFKIKEGLCLKHVLCLLLKLALHLFVYLYICTFILHSLI